MLYLRKAKEVLKNDIERGNDEYRREQVIALDFFCRRYTNADNETLNTSPYKKSRGHTVVLV